jgi:hypothetical protein
LGGTASRGGAAGIALVVLGVGALAGAGGLAYQRAGAQQAVAGRARDTSQALTVGLATLKRDLARELDEAAEVRQFVAALENRADAVTFIDLFDNEEWWEPYRARGAAVGRGGELVVARGLDPAVAGRLIRHTEGQSGAVVESGGELYLVAVGTYQQRRIGGFTLLLARRLDPATLNGLVGPAVDAVVLSDGRRVRATLGEAELAAAAAGLVGRERESTLLAPSGEWVAASLPIAENLWAIGVGRGGVWTAPRAWLGACLAAGGLLLLVGIGLLLRRRPPATVAAPLPALSPMMDAPAIPRTGRRTGIDVPGGRGSSLGGSRSVFPASGGTPIYGSAIGAGGGSAIRGTAGGAAATALAAQGSQQFGRYKLIERIAEGGMAEVFTAVLSGAEGFERLVVIKRLKPHLALNPEAVNQFIDEAKLGSRLTHSNIVTVLDFGKVGDGYYLAEEYVLGRTLAQIAARQQEKFGTSVPPALIYYMAHEVLAGMAYAHERTDDQGRPLAIVHRDISPTNIMVSMQAEVKLLDFGIVKAAERVSRTREGNVKGNVGYMAPEQARGLEATPRSDLFSLGIVMFDLLSGEPFYRGGGSGEILYQAATGPTVDHLARIDNLPRPAPEVLRGVLALDPAARHPSARAFADALAPAVVVGKAQLAEMMRALFL